MGVRVNQVKVQHGDGNGGSGCIKETNPKLLVVKFLSNSSSFLLLLFDAFFDGGALYVCITLTIQSLHPNTHDE